MMLILSILGIFCFFSTSTVAENQLQVIVLDIDFTFNPEYFAPGGEAYLLDNGITNEVYVNFTIIKTIPESTMVRFRMLGATMGEYIVPIGINQLVPLCAGIEDPIVGAKFCNNMRITECPLLPGNYGNPSMILYTSEGLPDTFIRNKYRTISQLLTPENEDILRVDIYSIFDYFDDNQ